ncbi:MAG: lipocalin family protein [Bacteroidales bacterium]|nr:lipocalin family protein [Bacteroidales bacterium]
MKRLIIRKICYLLSITIIIMFAACKEKKEETPAVKPFEISKYLGLWYEIARLDFKYERGLNNTTAQYNLNENGTVKVLNKGFAYEKNEWKTAEGKAKFVKDTNEGRLKVSFFGPFYSAYTVVAIDKEYKYALVAGESLSYLWILSRSTTIPDTIKNQFLQTAKNLGYNTNDLIWVEHYKFEN